MSGTQAKIIRRNLEVLDKEKKKLFSAVDKHLAEVFQVGQQWIEEKQAHHMTFKEIKNYIDDAIELIMEKAESFTDTDETQEPPDSSQPQSLASTSLPGYSSPVPVASGIKSVVDEDTMKKILARIDNIQETVSSLQTATDSVTDKQKIVEKKVEENSKEMSDFQDQHARRVTDVEKQMKKLSKKQKEEANQVNTKLGKMETNITQLSSSLSETEHQNSEAMKRIENQMDLDREYASDQEQYCKTTLKETIQTVEDLTNRVEVLETSVNDLTTRTGDNTSSLGDLRVFKNKVARKFKSLDDGLKSLNKRIVETEGKTEMGNKIMGERIADVVKLKELLNANALNRGVNVEKLDTLAEEFGVLASRMKEIETVGTKKHIGFTARLPSSLFSYPVTSQSVCKRFIDVVSNLGGHYDPTSGVFTASLDGVYVAYLSIQQVNDGYIEATVRQSQVGKAVDRNGIEVCRVRACGEEHSMSGLGVVKMKVGDRLYVWVDGPGQNTRIYYPSSFSCFLIG